LRHSACIAFIIVNMDPRRPQALPESLEYANRGFESRIRAPTLDLDEDCLVSQKALAPSVLCVDLTS
jgi:hypothetical protein